MKKRMTKFICVLLVLVLAMGVLAACGNKEGGSNGGNTAKVDKPTEDREGNAIELPDEINKIAVFAPSIMQMVEAFGVTDKVIAIDTNTPMYVEGMDSVMQFNMMEPDVEKIAELEPDVVFTTGMSYQGNDPYAALREMGICVITIPTSSSIEAIKEDITFVGDCLGGDAVAKAKEINTISLFFSRKLSLLILMKCFRLLALRIYSGIKKVGFRFRRKMPSLQILM